MSVVFDAHAHCFPPFGEDRGYMTERLAEYQYHVRFHKQSLLLFQSQCDFLTGDERDLILGGNLERLYPSST